MMKSYDYDCLADESLFHKAEKDIPLAIRIHLPEEGVPCHYNGDKGRHCAGCPFGREKYTAAWFDEAYEYEDELQFGSYS